MSYYQPGCLAPNVRSCPWDFTSCRGFPDSCPNLSKKAVCAIFFRQGFRKLRDSRSLKNPRQPAGQANFRPPQAPPAPYRAVFPVKMGNMPDLNKKMNKKACFYSFSPFYAPRHASHRAPTVAPPPCHAG